MTRHRRPAVRILTVILLTVACATVAAQQDDQRPRTQAVDQSRLLPINRDYFDLAVATGGDFYFWGPGEFASANVDVPGRGEDVVLSYGGSSAGVRHFEIPVESGVKELIVFCGVQRKDLAVLVRPDGTVVRDMTEGAKVQSFRFMTIVNVASPEQGIWTLELTGAGTHAVSARVAPGVGGPSLDRFEFVEVRGRPGHEGYFEIDRPLVSGERVACQAEVSNAKGAVSFEFVDQAGATIASPVLEPSDGGFLGTCTVPDAPFRLVVKGNDQSGALFMRITSSLTTPR